MSCLNMQYAGVDVPYQPRLTWALGHTDRGEAQTAYRVSVTAFTATGWASHYDSGVVKSNQSQNVHLQATLTPETLYSWTVQYTDSKGAVSPWAQNATFSTGVKNWDGASWIGQSVAGCFQARKGFTIPTTKPVARATVYGLGLGYYKLYVDGTKVSTHELGAFTTYSKRVYYDTYDVTTAIASTPGTAHTIAASVFLFIYFIFLEISLLIIIISRKYYHCIIHVHAGQWATGGTRNARSRLDSKRSSSNSFCCTPVSAP